MCEGHIMLIYIPVPLSLAMSNLSSPMTQQLSHYQYQQHHHPHHHHQQQSPQNQQAPPPQQQSTPPHQQQPPLATVSLSRNSTSIMCAAPTQTPHHAPHHHHITVAHHQTSQMNGASGYVGAAAGFASPPGGYTSVPRLHHCNAHSFLCSNPAYHQYQVSGGCLGHPPNYVTPFVAAGHAAPILSHSASTQLLPAASHPQLYTQPAVSIGQPPVQQIGPSAQQAVSAPAHALQHPQIPHPHHHHHQHHHHPHPHPHPHQQPTIVSPFPSHTHIHQIPHTPHAPTSTGARGSGIEVLSRGLYRSSSQGHVIGRVRRGGTLPGMGGNRRGGNTWRGGNMQPVPPPTLPPPPLPTTAAAAAAYPGILLHFLAMLSHPSLHQFNSVEPVVAPEAPDTENYEALLHLAERLGEAKPRGLIKTAIDQLPSYRYTGETCETKQTTCVICMCEFELRQMLRVLPCLHEFHSKCVDKWLKSNRTCPICRGDAGDYLKEAPMSE